MNRERTRVMERGKKREKREKRPSRRLEQMILFLLEEERTNQNDGGERSLSRHENVFERRMRRTRKRGGEEQEIERKLPIVDVIGDSRNVKEYEKKRSQGGP